MGERCGETCSLKLNREEGTSHGRAETTVVRVGVVWHLWFIDSFSNEYFQNIVHSFKKICAEF